MSVFAGQGIYTSYILVIKKVARKEMKLRSKKYRDLLEDIKPVTDEEFEELLNEPKKDLKHKKRKKKVF